MSLPAPSPETLDFFRKCLTAEPDFLIEKMKTLLKIVSIAKADKKTAFQAINSGWNDFEDAVQYSVAKKLKAKYIVTRNKKDFSNSRIAVVTPKEFLELIGR